MQIDAYMRKHGLSQKRFGELVGVTQSMVWQWLNERRPISAKQARLIDEATNGAIKRHELRPDIFEGAR